MRDLVIFGAGASAFSGAVHPYAPPLGDGLFDELRRNAPAWTSLPDELANEFAGPGKFEAGMSAIDVTGRSHLIANLLRDMALYFYQFEPRAHNLYNEFVGLVSRHTQRWMVATLNYDFLLEAALGQHGIHYVHFGRYDSNIKHMKVLKVHGSPNFMSPTIAKMDVRRVQIVNFKHALDADDCQSLPQYEALELLVKAKEEENDMVVPAMALYAPGKRSPWFQTFVSSIQAEYADQVRRARRIHVVGVRYGADPHIWEPLAQSAAPLRFYNPNADDLSRIEEWAQASRRPAFLIQAGFDRFVADVKQGKFGSL